MKAANVIVNGQVEVTAQMESWADLPALMEEMKHIDGVEIRPAGGKVFGRSRTCAAGYVRRDNKWWTL